MTKFDFPPMGTLYAPNLTPSENISDWTDGEVIRAIREGVHKDGRSLLVMPAGGYRNLSDEDVQALVAFEGARSPLRLTKNIQLRCAQIVTLSAKSTGFEGAA